MFTPWTRDVFNIVVLSKVQWLYVILISIAPIVIMELQKKLNEIIFGKTVYKYKDAQN